jgi:NADPH-dependent 7-cyano-7-deazaguanine reductase QueF
VLIVETHELFARDSEGTPHFYQVRLDIVPGESCLESKSLKQLLWALMEEWGVDQGITAPELAGQITDAVWEAVHPHYCNTALTDRDTHECVQVPHGDHGRLPARLNSCQSQSARAISKCPITGQPDFYVVTASLQPGSAFRGLLLSSYLDAVIMRATWGAGKHGMFAEALAGKLAQQLSTRVHADRCRVELDQSPRGGIKLIAVAEV